MLDFLVHLGQWYPMYCGLVMALGLMVFAIICLPDRRSQRVPATSGQTVTWGISQCRADDIKTGTVLQDSALALVEGTAQLYDSDPPTWISRSLPDLVGDIHRIPDHVVFVLWFRINGSKRIPVDVQPVERSFAERAQLGFHDAQFNFWLRLGHNNVIMLSTPLGHILTRLTVR